MTRKGKIIFWSISFILAFTAVSLRSILLDFVFLILNIAAYYIIKSYCKKENDTSDPKTQQLNPLPDNKKEQDNPIAPSKEDTEVKIKKCTGNCSTCERDTCIEEQEKPK